jgi:CHAT domain-containing protein
MAHGERLTVASLLARPTNLQARLVVLSACQTAICDFSELPDELAGLPSAFLQAGVRGSRQLWPVNDPSTSVVMKEFYRRHLEEKQDVPTAVRNA